MSKAPQGANLRKDLRASASQRTKRAEEAIHNPAVYFPSNESPKPSPASSHQRVCPSFSALTVIQMPKKAKAVQPMSCVQKANNPQKEIVPSTKTLKSHNASFSTSKLASKEARRRRRAPCKRKQIADKPCCAVGCKKSEQSCCQSQNPRLVAEKPQKGRKKPSRTGRVLVVGELQITTPKPVVGFVVQQAARQHQRKTNDRLRKHHAPKPHWKRKPATMKDARKTHRAWLHFFWLHFFWLHFFGFCLMRTLLPVPPTEGAMPKHAHRRDRSARAHQEGNPCP